jgi:hypothetical protein
VLGVLGFSLPRPLVFSIEAAADDLRRFAGDLSLSRALDDLAGPFRQVERRVLGVLKLSVLCWARLLAGDAWEVALQEIVEQTGGAPFRGIHRMTLGDWKSSFATLPKRLQDGSAPTAAVFHAHTRTLKRLKTIAILDNFVRVRNRIAHPDDEPLAAADLADSVGAVAGLLDELTKSQMLPVVLDPQEERRDRWGRRLLVAVDGRGRTREFVVRDSIELTEPLVWIPRIGNPREVDPIFVVAPELESLVT